MTRAQIKTEILIRARICQLRKLAADTSAACDEVMLAKAREILDRHADIDIPAEHRRLRMMLLGRLLPPPKKE
jgi:hypothetical protein